MKDRGEFLFEIGCEEIPGGLLPRAVNELKALLDKHLGTARILGSAISAYGAPRRLAAISNAVLLQQKDEKIELLGPPKSVAFDNVGQPTRAALSFCEKQKLNIADLYTTMTPRGEYLATSRIIPGKSARELLAEILPRILRELTRSEERRVGTEC